MTYKYADKSERNDFINTMTVQQDQKQLLLDKIMIHLKIVYRIKINTLNTLKYIYKQ